MRRSNVFGALHLENYNFKGMHIFSYFPMFITQISSV